MGDAARRLCDLPDVILEFILAVDEVSLPLPLVCKSLHRLCTGDAVTALRLGVRLRMVGDVLRDQRYASSLDEWVTGHAWACISDVHDFLSGSHQEVVRRASMLMCSQSTLCNLRELLLRYGGMPALLPPPGTAEELYFSAETHRQKSQRSPWLEAATVRLNLECVGERRVLRQEAERQMKKQLAATCRRNWRQLPAATRVSWERRAADAKRHWERYRHTTLMATKLARSLQDEILPKVVDAKTLQSLRKPVPNLRAEGARLTEERGCNAALALPHG